MKRIKSSRPSPAFVIACIALFASMGGVSYAVATGSIDSREIQNRTIQGEDVKNGAITQREVQFRSLDGINIMKNRVGGNAVKEESLEVGKLKTVPSAAIAGNGTRWVLVGADGSILAQSGGFSLVDCYQANANCYIDSGETDVRQNGVSTEIVTANGATDAGVDGELTGDTSSSPCFFDFVQCGPDGTDDNNGGNPGVFVVAPRNSDGSAPAAGDRYPFYAFIQSADPQ